MRKLPILLIVTGAAMLNAAAPTRLDEPLSAAAVAHVPGHRTPAPFVGSTDPFLDLATAEPRHIEQKSVISAAEATGKAFAAEVSKFNVTNAVLTNDPDFRSVVIDGVPLRQGQVMPTEMFNADFNGSVTVKEITSSTVVFELDGRDSNSATAAITYCLGYQRHRPRK